MIYYHAQNANKATTLPMNTNIFSQHLVNLALDFPGSSQPGLSLSTREWASGQGQRNKQRLDTSVKSLKVFSHISPKL